MSSDSNHFLKKIAKQVRKESIPLIEAAIISGANNVGNQLLDAASEVNQPTKVLLRKLATALRSGVLATGQEMLTVGLDRIKKIS